jgi:predicted metal-dependent peptidase
VSGRRGGADLGPQRQRMAAARLWAANRFPYLASALFASPVVFVEGLGTVTADRSWRLYADPEIVAAWPPEITGAMLVHHVGHLLREHADRAGLAGVGHDETDAWLDAADAEINDDLVDVLTLPEDRVVPADLGQEVGRLAEEYFVARRDGERERHTHDCGSAAHGHDRPWEQGDGRPEDGSPGQDGLSPSAGELVRRQVAGEIVNHAKQAGHVPAGLLRWAQAVLEPKVDWRRALAAELRRGVREVNGRVDYSYRRPSRRASAVADVVLPSLRRPTPEVAIVCDTSGSMTEDDLAKVLAEVEGLLRSVGLAGARVLSVDTEAHGPAQRVRSAHQVSLEGGGGTDMGAGIDAALALRPRPQVIVVLTDGETPWPSAAPRGAVVVVGLIGSRAPAAPTWARSVRIDEAA